MLKIFKDGDDFFKSLMILFIIIGAVFGNIYQITASDFEGPNNPEQWINIVQWIFMIAFLSVMWGFLGLIGLGCGLVALMYVVGAIWTILWMIWTALKIPLALITNLVSPIFAIGLWFSSKKRS